MAKFWKELEKGGLMMTVTIYQLKMRCYIVNHDITLPTCNFHICEMVAQTPFIVRCKCSMLSGQTQNCEEAILKRKHCFNQIKTHLPQQCFYFLTVRPKSVVFYVP